MKGSYRKLFKGVVPITVLNLFLRSLGNSFMMTVSEPTLFRIKLSGHDSWISPKPTRFLRRSYVSSYRAGCCNKINDCTDTSDEYPLPQFWFRFHSSLP